MLVKLALLLVSSSIAVSAAHERSRRSRPLHSRLVQNVNNETDIVKRDTYGGRATFYDVGLGACGGYKWVISLILILVIGGY